MEVEWCDLPSQELTDGANEDAEEKQANRHFQSEPSDPPMVCLVDKFQAFA